MSVREKREQIRAARAQFDDKERAFEAYAESFAADVADKRDVSEFTAARDALVEAMEATDDTFAVYSDVFDDEVERFQADVAAEASVFEEAAAHFDAYAAAFESDVRDKQDVTHLLEAIDALSDEMAAVEATFASYSEDFDEDVAEIQDISALQNAIAALQESFVDVTGSFEAYSTAFDADVEAIHESVADHRAAVTQTTEAFEAYERTFHEEGVQSVLDAASAFRETIEAFHTEFDATEAEFAAYTADFYGVDDTEAGETNEPVDEAAGETEAETRDAVTTERAVSVDISVDEPVEESVDEPLEESVDEPLEESVNEPLEESVDEPVEESPAADDGLDDDSEMVDTTIESETDTEPTEDPTVEADDGDDDEVNPVADGLVQCLVCGEYYQAITEPHLQTHDMTIQDYRDEYGEDVPLRPDDDE